MCVRERYISDQGKQRWGDRRVGEHERRRARKEESVRVRRERESKERA